jgi:hypothetical protein
VSGDYLLAIDAPLKTANEAHYESSWEFTEHQDFLGAHESIGKDVPGGLSDHPFLSDFKAAHDVRPAPSLALDSTCPNDSQSSSNYQESFVHAIKQLDIQPWTSANVVLWPDLPHTETSDVDLELSGTLPMVATDTDCHILYMIQRAKYCISVQNYLPTSSQLIADLIFDNPLNLLATDIKQILSPMRQGKQTGTYLGVCWVIYLVLQVRCHTFKTSIVKIVTS